ncbi:MAG: 50S ribosomal protein L11 methyltransferase, partial [Deltaproteobacteria bacterium]
RDETGVDRTTLRLYAPASAGPAVARAVAAAAEPGARVGPPEPVAPVDWTRAWQEGLTAIVISPRLVVRPSFVEHTASRSQQTVIIDPGRAFGTGHHASTRLALELLDRVLAGNRSGRGRLLDVGTGSGVLAIAALRLGIASAVAFDLDLVAVRAAHGNAERNGVRDRMELFAGGLEALAETGFELVTANLLRTELVPLVPGIARRIRAGGHVIVSGILASERDAVASHLSQAGLQCADLRTATDPGGDAWIGLLAQR